MAQKVVTTLIDDLDGGDAAETVTFALDGISYEIDLNESNAATLRSAFDTYIHAGRRTARTAVARQLTAKNSKEDLASAREWLRAQGEKVSDRGRIPAALLERFRREA